MACLTPEQLAAIALGLEGSERSVHIDECPACQAQLSELRGLTHELAASHVDLNHRHAASRTALLDGLPPIEPAPTASPHWKRLAFGGLGLSSAVAALLLVSVFLNSATQLSAMERIVQAVREVRSFSYRLNNITNQPAKGGKPARTLDGNTFTFWRAPPKTKPDEFGDLRAADTHEWVYHLSTGDKPPELTLDLVEIHPSGQPGILIDYVAKKFYRVPPLHARDIADSTPLLWLRAVRDQLGCIVDDLGRRQIGGRDVHGYVMAFESVESFKDFGPVEVWIDPQTDLPLEFSFRYAKADDEGFTDQYSVTDIQWNASIDPKLFDTTPPAGFLDITLPQDERSIAEIVQALQLYARLGSDRYPRGETFEDKQFATKFDATTYYREMLELAGFTGPHNDEWTRDPTYQQIQQSLAGLVTLERVLASYKWLVGYNGATVTANDKDLVLLWWNIPMSDPKDERYRVFYGDLRTEIVPREKWVQFVPPEIAEITE
jgi:hypothetical protein